MNKITKVPKLRFPKFTDEWEQRKLKDIANKVTTKNSGTLYVETLTNSAEFGIISQKDFFDHNISNLENIDGYYIVENNDFVYNPRISTTAPVGPINRNKLGRSGVMSPLYTVFRTHDVDEEYVEWFFKSSKWHKFMFFNGDTGARSDRFAIKDSVFFEMPIPIPHIDEQRKIGHFFSNLDSLITLHQRKLDNLNSIKKSMLDKLFPKKGEKYPEVRFEGFTGEWEQRKLKDIASFIRGSFPQPYTNPDFYDEKEGKPFVQVADIGMGLELNKDTKTHISRIAESKSRFVKAGTVIVALQGSIERSIGRTAITQYDAFVDRTILIFESYRIPIDKIFFAQSIKKLFQKEKEKAWGATISTITKEHLSDFILGIPSLDEQAKIGLFFKNIDNIITLYQRKLDNLNNIKKGFLQQMFI